MRFHFFQIGVNAAERRRQGPPAAQTGPGILATSMRGTLALARSAGRPTQGRAAAATYVVLARQEALWRAKTTEVPSVAPPRPAARPDHTSLERRGVADSAVAVGGRGRRCIAQGGDLTLFPEE